METGRRRWPAVRRRLSAAAPFAGGVLAAFLALLLYASLFRGPAPLTPQAVNEAWIARCRDQMRGALALLEAKLGGAWFIDDRFSQADITTGAMIGYLKLRLPEIDVAREYPRLAALSARCEAMACFAAARPSADEVMPSQ